MRWRRGNRLPWRKRKKTRNKLTPGQTSDEQRRPQQRFQHGSVQVTLSAMIVIDCIPT